MTKITKKLSGNFIGKSHELRMNRDQKSPENVDRYMNCKYPSYSLEYEELTYERDDPIVAARFHL